MINKYLDVLVNQLDDKINQIQEALGNGSAKDFVEYKAMCGEVKGLLTARLNIKDLQQRVRDHDDE
jgi:hypothetical protein